jgi:leader peptidase (prepilin peptidase) / N-methyltransferase
VLAIFRVVPLQFPLPPWLLLAISAPFIGSFLGVLISRLPQSQPLVFARSKCDSCNQPLGAPDLFPVLSWLVAGAKCRYCGASVSVFYPAIELAALAVVLWAATETSGWILLLSCIFGWMLLALSIIDWRHFILPDVLTLPLIAIGLGASIIGPLGDPVDHLIGAVAGFAVLTGIAFLYARLRRRPGLGFGDSKLLAGIGAWVTWIGLPTVVLYATVFGLIAVLIVAARGKRPELTDRVPFGTFLALGGWLVWLYGPLTISFN